ncbi:MAG TPA: hypothetical protein VFB34_12270 [Chloroflexota bacterium]|nr:hypothetical protein [Chloroflexota bacterium]
MNTLRLRHLLPTAILIGVLFAFGLGTVLSAAPSTGSGLLGTWKVTRVCVSGCSGSATSTETVKKLRSHVFTATGTNVLVLLRFDNGHVLVHGGNSSSYLTVAKPGRLMRGVGIDQAGDRLTVRWRCVAAATSSQRQGGRHHAGRRPFARGIC